MTIYLLFLLFNSLMTHDANNNNLQRQQITPSEFDTNACLRFLQSCPNEIMQEIQNHYFDAIPSYSKLLNKHYVLGYFKQKTLVPFYDDVDGLEIFPVKGPVFDFNFRRKFLYKENHGNKAKKIYIDNKTYRSTAAAYSNFTQLNAKRFFFVNPNIIQILSPSKQKKSAEKIRIIPILDKSDQELLEVAIHPTTNLLVTCPEVKDHEKNRLDIYSWDINNALKEYALVAQENIGKVFFIPSSVDHILVISNGPKQWRYYSNNCVKMYLQNFRTSQIEKLGKIALPSNVSMPKDLSAYIQFLPKDSKYLTYLMLANVSYKWLNNHGSLKEGTAILNTFKQLQPREKRELIWKTTTPQHGNLFKDIHDRVKRLEQEIKYNEAQID